MVPVSRLSPVRTRVSATARRAARDPLFDPTPEHAELRAMIKSFAANEVEPQAKEFDIKGCAPHSAAAHAHRVLPVGASR
jgi:hypothetical protein